MHEFCVEQAKISPSETPSRGDLRAAIHEMDESDQNRLKIRLKRRMEQLTKLMDGDRREFDTMTDDDGDRLKPINEDDLVCELGGGYK